jgi:hypothetical protein
MLCLLGWALRILNEFLAGLFDWTYCMQVSCTAAAIQVFVKEWLNGLRRNCLAVQLFVGMLVALDVVRKWPSLKIVVGSLLLYDCWRCGDPTLGLLL